MAERDPYIYQFDDIFWLTISGTFFAFLGVAKEDIFDPDDPQVVQKIINIVNTERD